MTSVPRPDPASARASRRGRQRGQSVVEFALVVPIIFTLVLGMGDLGRVFAIAVNLEGATRDTAEAVANEYLSAPPGPLNGPAPAAAAGYYDHLRLVGGRVACAESRGFPGVTLDSALATCPGMPYVVVCVHDGRDDGCSEDVNGAAIPAACGELVAPPTNAQASGARRYVEVRTCYRYDSLVNVPLISFGTIWLQRTRVFDIPCYYSIGPEACGA